MNPGANPVPSVVPLALGSLIRLKKPHACGGNSWEVTKLGMDIGLKCRDCEREIRLIRSEVDRRFRGFIEA